MFWFAPALFVNAYAAALHGHQEYQQPLPPIRCDRQLTSPFAGRPDDHRNGLVNNTAIMSPANLLRAYSQGVFPWAEGEWYNPPSRGVLFLNEVHISRSDRKLIRKMLDSGEYEVTDDKDFQGVISGCADMKRLTRDRNGQLVPAGDWITQAFIDGYTKLHKSGYAHSVEVWHHGRLAGGLYGVFIKGVFSGESMFRLPDEPNVTKLAMLHLIERLSAQGHQFIDTQMAVGLAGKWGARKIPRAEFLTRLRLAQKENRIY